MGDSTAGSRTQIASCRGPSAMLLFHVKGRVEYGEGNMTSRDRRQDRVDAAEMRIQDNSSVPCLSIPSSACRTKTSTEPQTSWKCVARPSFIPLRACCFEQGRTRSSANSNQGAARYRGSHILVLGTWQGFVLHEKLVFSCALCSYLVAFEAAGRRRDSSGRAVTALDLPVQA